jgi:hypothetical protein
MKPVLLELDLQIQSKGEGFDNPVRAIVGSVSLLMTQERRA